MRQRPTRSGWHSWSRRPGGGARPSHERANYAVQEEFDEAAAYKVR
jgi:hypothetical protein